MRASGGAGDGQPKGQIFKLSFHRVLIKIRESEKKERGRRDGADLAVFVDELAQGAKKNRKEGGVTGGAVGGPEPRKTINRHRQQQDDDRLHQHVAVSQTNEVGEDRDPLMGERRIGGLRESGEGLLIPWIEPVMSVVGGHRHMKVGVETVGGDAHHQERAVKGEGAENEQPDGDWALEWGEFCGSRSSDRHFG